jgi:plastocyanin
MRSFVITCSLAALAAAAGCAPADAPARESTQVILPDEQTLDIPGVTAASAARTPAAAAPATSAPVAAAPAPSSSPPPAASPSQAGFGALAGRVVLDGPRPDLPALLPAGALRDPEVCVREKIPNERLLVGDGGGIKNVFVYLSRKPSGAATASTPEAITFDQKNCTFIPHALVCRTGQELKFINSDPIAHNINTKTVLSAPFNQILKVSDQTGVPFTYSRAEREPVRVVCDIHAWMLAWHLPLDHPYAAVTDENGAFSIADLPPGNHKFIVWHESKRLQEYPVTITAGQTSEAQIKVPAASLATLVLREDIKTVVVSLPR